MKITQSFQAPDRAAWRTWLAENGQSASEVWLIYFKAGSGKPTVSYAESLEEALCFGWVDSLIQKIDEEQYARKFTPRKLGSTWSELNKYLAAKLIREGRMTAAGLAKVDFPLEEAPTELPKRAPLAVPDWMEAGLKASALAWEHFSKLPPSHQRTYILWLSDAKREETRQKRIQQAIGMLERNERLGIGEKAA